MQVVLSMKSKTKAILLAAAVLILAGGLTGFYLFNKAPLDVRTARGIKVKATDLYKTYATDTVKANKEFTGKVVAVTGEAVSVSENLQQQKIILIKTFTDGAYVNCTMEGDLGTIAPSQKVILKGIATGIGQGEPDLGIMGDVYLIRCYNEATIN